MKTTFRNINTNPSNSSGLGSSSNNPSLLLLLLLSAMINLVLRRITNLHADGVLPAESFPLFVLTALLPTEEDGPGAAAAEGEAEGEGEDGDEEESRPLYDLSLQLVPLGLGGVELLRPLGQLLLQPPDVAHTAPLQIFLLFLNQNLLVGQVPPHLLQLPQLVLHLGDVGAVEGGAAHSKLEQSLRVLLELVSLVLVVWPVVSIDVDGGETVQVTSDVGDCFLGNSGQPVLLSQTGRLPVLYLVPAVTPERGLNDDVIPELVSKYAVDHLHHGSEVNHLPDVRLFEGDHKSVDMFEVPLEEVDEVVNGELLLPQVHAEAWRVDNGDLETERE